MSSNKYAVFLDIDGTLMSNGIIPQKNIDAITSAQRLGHRFFINTGRSYANIPRELFDTVNFDGVVAGIGSYVRFGDEVVKSITVPAELLKKVAECFMPTDVLCLFEGEEKLLYLNANDKEDKLVIKNSNDFLTIYKDIRISKATVFGVLTDKQTKLLEEDFTVIQYEDYAEFALKGCSKASGMKTMLKRLSLNRENSIAVGDSANDIDMLKYAGISIAMGNSSEEVKKICDFVSDTVDNAGVAAALEKYLLSS